MFHFWVIADMEGKDHELCRQWIDDCKTYCKDCKRQYPSLAFDMHRRYIPKATGANVRDAYHKIAVDLGEAIEKANPSERFVAVLDARVWAGLNNLPSLHSVQGLLILAFPEVLWIPVFKKREKDAKDDIKTAIDLVAGGFNPMFDGTGVRGALIRYRHPNGEYPYIRDDVAVTIDEEQHFAELTAYTAFRFGYRAYPISTERLAKLVLIKSKTELPSIANACVSPDASIVVFEDGEIEFPDCNDDQNEEHHLGYKRDEVWRLLALANLRVLATVAGPDDQIALRKTTAQTRQSEYIPTTARKWFEEKQVKELGVDKEGFCQDWLEKTRRLCFNLFAGGMGGVWAFELIKWVIIIATLWGFFSVCPFFLLLALFLVFVLLGLLRNAIDGVLLFLFGRNAPIRVAFQKCSQWRFYPKLFINHVPRNGIHTNGNPTKTTHYWCHIQKPLGGIFGLRNQCGLPNSVKFKAQLDANGVKELYQKVLKTQNCSTTMDNSPVLRHSVHGRTLDIATDLITRSRVLKERGGGVKDAIHAAVLATSAYELLGNKTPALSIEALELRHYCEVMAECEFPGIRAELDMKDRLIDIHNSLSQICRATDGTIREDMFENGMAAICDSLSDLLSSRGRFSESAFLTRHARYMHRLLLPSLGRGCLVFPEWVLRSYWHFAISFSTVILLFFGYWMGNVRERLPEEDRGLFHAITKTYEVLVCDEPDLSWPGRKEDERILVKEQNNIQDPDSRGFKEYIVRYPIVKDDGDESKHSKRGDDTSAASSSIETSKFEEVSINKDIKDNIINKDDYTLFAHTMRLMALLHLAFLGVFFWDAMRQK